MDIDEEEFKALLKKHLPEVLNEMAKEGMFSIMRHALLEDKETLYSLRIKPSWNRPTRKRNIKLAYEGGIIE